MSVCRVKASFAYARTSSPAALTVVDENHVAGDVYGAEQQRDFAFLRPALGHVEGNGVDALATVLVDDIDAQLDWIARAVMPAQIAPRARSPRPCARASRMSCSTVCVSVGSTSKTGMPTSSFVE